MFNLDVTNLGNVRKEVFLKDLVIIFHWDLECSSSNSTSDFRVVIQLKGKLSKANPEIARIFFKRSLIEKIYIYFLRNDQSVPPLHIIKEQEWHNPELKTGNSLQDSLTYSKIWGNSLSSVVIFY